jgi:hypothetical protein
MGARVGCDGLCQWTGYCRFGWRADIRPLRTEDFQATEGLLERRGRTRKQMVLRTVKPLVEATVESQLSARGISEQDRMYLRIGWRKLATVVSLDHRDMQSGTRGGMQRNETMADGTAAWRKHSRNDGVSRSETIRWKS